MQKSFFLFLFLITFSIHAQNKPLLEKLDSINKYRTLSQNSELGFELREKYALKATEISKELGKDSTILKSKVYLSGVYLYYDKYDKFGPVNHTILPLARKLNDSLRIGNTFYNLGWYHFQKTDIDSAYYYYYNAQNIFNVIGKEQKEAEVLLNMANIQESARDYVGSEAAAIRAINLLENLSDELDENLEQRSYDTLWSLYNLLAIISERLENHEEAINYYQECLKIAKKINQPYFYILSSKNNIGNSLAKKGDLNEALLIFEEVLNDKNSFQVYPEIHVHVLENIAQTKFKIGKTDTQEIENYFKEADRLSDSLGYIEGKMANNKNFSQFYFDIGEKEKALKIAKENYKLASEANSNLDALSALLLMSQIEEGQEGKEHLNKYIKLSDSLVKNERAARNKFARIRFEVDKIEADNKQLAKERLLFLLISIGLLLSLTLLYVVITQRAKNRKLKFIQQQQETNEEIYNLMLAQQDKVNEGRQVEKKRISQELHDGVLGKLFGTRLSLDSLNLVLTEDAAKTRSQYINELKKIETEIRKISHDLNADFIGDSSFIDIIKTLIDTQTTAYGLESEFSNDEEIDWETIPNKTKIHIYRMLQETMQNIYKHAEANLVKISFKLKNDLILCVIEDDGKGFNVSKARRGIGLKNIDSRVNDVGGKAEVFSKINVGTKIKIFIPAA